MWPFGTSKKDRRRIDSLESEVRELKDNLRRLCGSDPMEYLGGYYGFGHYRTARGHTLSAICRTLDELRKTDSEIMEACDLVTMVQPSKTWIAKKKDARK